MRYAIISLAETLRQLIASDIDAFLPLQMLTPLLLRYITQQLHYIYC